jgi:folylpolyglutamate synthase/dihydropteroate synthase
MARESGIGAVVSETPRRALDEALRLAGSDGWVLVTGSLHLVGAVRRFTRAYPPNG